MMLFDNIKVVCVCVRVCREEEEENRGATYIDMYILEFNIRMDWNNNSKREREREKMMIRVWGQ